MPLTTVTGQPFRKRPKLTLLQLFNMLLAHGADITPVNDLGWNLLFIARRNQNKALIELVEEYSRS